jgi:hypothetical protein
VLGKVEKVQGGAGMGSMIHDGDPARPKVGVVSLSYDGTAH